MTLYCLVLELILTGASMKLLNKPQSPNTLHHNVKYYIHTTLSIIIIIIIFHYDDVTIFEILSKIALVTGLLIAHSIPICAKTTPRNIQAIVDLFFAISTDIGLVDGLMIHP